MNDIRRIVLWVIFGFSIVLLWDQWQIHNGHRATFFPVGNKPAATAPAAATGGGVDGTASAVSSVPSPVTSAAVPGAVGASQVPIVTAAAAPAAPSSGPRDGETVFKGACFACHDTGAAGAPKRGDKAAWEPRIAQGFDTLRKHAIEGFTGKAGMMPPRGTCATCSDEEIENAIHYMIDKL